MPRKSRGPGWHGEPRAHAKAARGEKVREQRGSQRSSEGREGNERQQRSSGGSSGENR